MLRCADLRSVHQELEVASQGRYRCKTIRRVKQFRPVPSSAGSWKDYPGSACPFCRVGLRVSLIDTLHHASRLSQAAAVIIVITGVIWLAYSATQSIILSVTIHLSWLHAIDSTIPIGAINSWPTLTMQCGFSLWVAAGCMGRYEAKLWMMAMGKERTRIVDSNFRGESFIFWASQKCVRSYRF